jgi:haloalkane dehalogenase
MEGVAERPAWLDRGLYPFEDHYADIAGCRVHYVDEGSGPLLLMLHGNPTWSFLYRDLVKGLRDRFRCVAIDYPGFGLSTAPEDYGFTPAEHAAIVEQLVLELDLRDVTPVVQDWGGPIGFAVAGRHPDRFSGFVIGNTFAWPVTGRLSVELFSRLMGGPIGGHLIRRRNFFVERVLPGGVRRHKLPEEVMAAYRGPFPTIESRKPLHVLPREILGSSDFLAEVERGLPVLSDRPALIVWPTKDVAFGETERERFESLFPRHRTVTLEGAGHYIQEDAPEEIVAAIRSWEEDGRSP